MVLLNLRIQKHIEVDYRSTDDLGLIKDSRDLVLWEVMGKIVQVEVSADTFREQDVMVSQADQAYLNHFLGVQVSDCILTHHLGKIQH